MRSKKKRDGKTRKKEKRSLVKQNSIQKEKNHQKRIHKGLRIKSPIKFNKDQILIKVFRMGCVVVKEIEYIRSTKRGEGIFLVIVFS